MLWEILLSATIEAMLGLLAEVGLGEALRDLREAWAHTDARRRRRALEQALRQATQAAQDEEVRLLLEHRPFQEEVVRALLDPERPFDVRALAEHWGARFPQHAPALQRFFVALQNALLADATWGPVLARYQTLRWQEEVQKALREHALPTEATLVPAVARALSAYQARLEGDGAIAQGTGAKAVGPRGVSIGGAAQGNTIQTGDTHIHLGEPSEDPDALERAYLSALMTQAGQLSLEGIDPQAASEAEKRLSLGAVYTALLTLAPEAHEKLERGEMAMRETRRRSALEELNPRSNPALWVSGKNECSKNGYLGRG